MKLTADARLNRTFWNKLSDGYQAAQGRQLAIHGAAWGVWQIPEDELRVLGEVADRDVLELGCGAAQWSIWLTQRGARAVGLDVSDRQLRHARRLAAEAGVDIELVHASAEAVPLPDERFDVVFCDHGAMVFADPKLTVPEVSRLLRDGGTFAFSMFTPFAEVCWPADEDEPVQHLANDYFGMQRVDVGGSAHVEFQLPYGDWIRLFVANHLEVMDLIELQPAEDATSTYRSVVSRAWGRRWPLEHIWKLRRRPR
jgi:SAM-dependent methyltransferase